MMWVLAVSGGVDSVVLLDMVAKHNNKKDIIVAHFDHGMRVDSAEDARFVKALAAQYGVQFETAHEDLGSSASENTARERRYRFLQSVASKHNAKLVTAHHKNDVVETIAINIQRGTGWRGIAVFGDESIIRPLTGKTKDQLYSYAKEHNLEWIEDGTNISSKYLRNRLRRRIGLSLEDVQIEEIYNLYLTQKELRKKIDLESAKLHCSPYSRYFFIMISERAADELIRAFTSGHLLPSQRARTLIAIKTARPGSILEAGNGLKLRFTNSTFVAENSSQLL